MLWQDPFEPPRTDQATGSHPLALNIQYPSSSVLDMSGTNEDHAVDAHGHDPFPSISWNDRRSAAKSDEFADEPTPRLGTFTQSFVGLIAIWSWCELPIELLGSRTTIETAALIAAKLVWLCLTLWVLSGSRAAKTVFVFCCSVSTVSIATGLAAEFHFFALGFCLSLVDCGLKAAVVLLIIRPANRLAAQ